MSNTKTDSTHPKLWVLFFKTKVVIALICRICFIQIPSKKLSSPKSHYLAERKSFSQSVQSMKKFHIAGPCLSHKHYMANTSAKLSAITELIENGDYFIINRPRQYGKTTTLFTINRQLQSKEDYLVLPISFEGIGDLDFTKEADFCREFTALIAEKILIIDESIYKNFLSIFQNINRLSILSRAVTQWLRKISKKVILLIDEVDQSSNHEVFLKFLGVLRNKYIQANQGLDFTFHSVILAGVHDIKNLKMKIRSDGQRHLNSPWNIATEFKVNMSFQTNEIIPMLEDYVAERNVKMNIPAIAQQLYDYTSGYPFLVSKICKVADETILPQKKENSWTKSDIDKAVSQMVKEENFNFDSVIKNLENNPDLYNTVQSILLETKFISFNIHNPVIKMGVTYGIFKNHGSLQIHNPVYEQIIYNYMVSKIETAPDDNRYYHYGQFVLPNQELDVDKVLLKFQAFMQEQFNERDKTFLERNGRLVFLSFLKPILNGQGHTFVEPQISDEKRLDVVITFFQHKYIIELKMWYGQKTHEAGLLQLVDYLDRQNQDKGWLVIFEHQRKKTWGKKAIKKQGKNVFAVWV